MLRNWIYTILINNNNNIPLIQSSHKAWQHRLGLRLSRTTAIHKLGLGCHAGQPMVLDQRWAGRRLRPRPTDLDSEPAWNSCWSLYTRKLISAYYSFIDLVRMKGWVDLVGWPAADGLPTWVVTRQLQVGCKTGKVRWLKTDVLPLSQRHQPIAITMKWLRTLSIQ